MKLNGLIFEKITKIGFSKERSVFYNEYSLYELVNKELDKIKSLPIDCTPQIACDGLWLTCNNTSSYYNLFKSSVSYPTLNFKISAESHSADRYLITKSVGGKPFKLNVIDKHNSSQNEIDFSRVFTYSFDDESIYVRTKGYKEITCYDYELKKQWEYNSLKGSVYIDFERKPQIHNNLLIINHAWDIIALDKKTGEEVWKYTFEDIPTSNILMQEKIYAVCKAQLYIIDPQNGDVLLKVDTGYPEFFPDTGQLSRDKNHIGIFPIGDYLYGIARSTGTGKQIRIYNKDCSKILCEANWNKENQEQYYLNPYSSIMPTIRGNIIYQRLRNLYSFADSGILVMELTEDESQVGIKVASRPPVTMVANPSLNVSHKLQVFLDVNNLDDALRYGDLLTNELLYTVGYYPIYDIRENALDTLHNGKVELIIDDTEFDEDDAGKYLSKLESQIKESIKNGNCVAGDKKTAIKFTLLTQAKADWDKSGEQLDWPAIRQQEIPLV